ASLLSLILVSVATACGEEGEATQQPVEVIKDDLTVSVSGNGNLETSREARLSFGSGGRIDRIYVEEGDKVSQGEVLAELDSDALELAKTQAEVALTQAEVALTQAQLAQKTSEYNLKNTLDTKETLELTLFNTQISLDQVKYNLEQVQDLYTWSDIKIAQADVDEAERYVEYCLEQLYKYLPVDEEGVYPKIEDDFTKTEGYKIWQDRLIHAQSRLNAAKDMLEAMQSGRDTEETAIKKKQVEAAELSVAQAQKNLDELTEDIALNELQIEAAKASVEQARESVELARESLEQSQKTLDEAIITAPIDGVVASISAEEGDIIPSPSAAPKPVIHLIDPGRMELVVEVDEIDIPGVKLGQEALITLDALPNLELTGVVTKILPVPTEISGVVLYDVKIELNVPEGSGIKVGMSASADIILTKRSNVLLVPDRAITEDSEGRTIVNVMVNEHIEERPVVIGISDGFDTEIISGLREGELVIETKR
ncbi:efflux RND transporter periplasmic adaptor subunit, partial [Chloroflexota bacterium]